jgi:hypothetical protein
MWRPKASNSFEFKFTIRSDTHYAISCLIIILGPPKNEKFNNKWGYQFFLIYKHQVIFLFFGNKYLKNLCRIFLKKTMIRNLFNPKINNKVVENTCLSNLKAKYHIA